MVEVARWLAALQACGEVMAAAAQGLREVLSHRAGASVDKGRCGGVRGSGMAARHETEMAWRA